MEHQEYLEHLVSVKSAIVEGRTGMVINVAAVILAIIQLQPFFADLLRGVYEGLGIEASTPRPRRTAACLAASPSTCSWS